MIASFPMYDRPETAPANDRLWALIRDALRSRGVDAPDQLTRAEDLMALWRAPDLLLAQTCGLPYRAVLHPHVTLVGTPDYGLPDCPAGYYCSVLVAREPLEVATARFAYNDPLSQSGWAAAQAMFGGALRPVLCTGSHRASARAVAQGEADLAAIDAVTWALIRRHDRFADGLIEIGRTTPAPGLPLVTARPDLAGVLASAVSEAIAALAPGDRACLMIRALVPVAPAEYLALPLPPKP
ncbi:phosphate/phosphite/phosphonate ABC transporter substrate-binding protein [Halodurantibacterium flavum]|uniref:Phosphate/phosphite/phosphonate ABC transporter substrate-binding protein n=1 Tax=Halodurantibacterium flavum TaxID=1382802 RepID=A0ABW4S4D9_9RHOB